MHSVFYLLPCACFGVSGEGNCNRHVGVRQEKREMTQKGKLKGSFFHNMYLFELAPPHVFITESVHVFPALESAQSEIFCKRDIQEFFVQPELL